MAEKQTNKDRLREITEGIEQGIKDLFQSDKYARYLSTMCRFHRYSVNNVMLIHLQKPDATLVAGFNKWKNQFGRHVKKGEHGITIIAPTPFKKKIEQQKLDPDTKAPVLDKDGCVVMEEKEVEIPLFRPVAVFDVSQTEGKPLPQLASDLTGDVRHYEIFMEALRRSSPVPMTVQAMGRDMDGYFDPERQEVAIRAGMSEVQTVSAAIHEITHAKLHNYEQARLATAQGDETKEAPKPKDRNTEEVEAESVSYAVCQYYGIETAENSFGYIATWSQGKELKELRASLETINKTASSLITDIDRHFAEICKERGVDLTAEMEQSAPTAEAPVQEPEPAPPPKVEEALYLLDGTQYLHIQLSEAGTWDFSLYDKQTLALQDGGLLDNPEFQIEKARDTILAEMGLYPQSVGAVPADQMEETMDAIQSEAVNRAGLTQVEPTHANPYMAELIEHFAAEDAAMWEDALEQTLDEYPRPDEDLETADLEACGYMDGDMLPLSKERALELYENDLTIYAIVDGGSAEMLFDRDEFEAQAPGTVFAVSREEWEESRDFDQLVQERMKHQEEREAAFLAYGGNCFAIYQVKHDEAQEDIRYESLDWLRSIGRKVERENYELVYTAPLQKCISAEAAMDELWYRFNNECPADYQHPSMSVSDIVAIRRNGELSCHYCDSFGFKKIPGFIQQDNPLKNAEMALEDDYGMIDGIINNGPKATVAELEQQARTGHPISLMDLADAVHRERQDRKKSVLEQLKQQPKAEAKKAAPKKSAEREI